MKSIRKLQRTLAAVAVAGYIGFAALGTAEAAQIVELTLQESIDMALENNRKIKESAEDLQKVIDMIDAKLFGLFPME